MRLRRPKSGRFFKSFRGCSAIRLRRPGVGAGVVQSSAGGGSIEEKTKKHSLLDIRPQTGRTNQIRIHLAYIGHPVIGDKLYGGEDAARMLLHSAKITFSHPDTGKTKTISAPMPPEFKKTWEEVKKSE